MAKEKINLFESASDIIFFLKDNSLFFVLLIGINIVVHANGLTGQFISGDDVAGINNNVFSFLGNNPIVRHSAALLVHTINSILVFILSQLIFGKRISYFSSSLFALHPVTVEATAWISGAPYLAVTFFSLLIFIFFVLYKNSTKVKYLYTSVALFAVALFLLKTPWILVSLPILIVMDQFIIEKKISVKLIKNYLLFLIPLPVFVFLFSRTSVSARIESLQNAETAGYIRFPYSLYMMLKLLIYPKDLSIFHEGNAINQIELYTIIISVTLFLALTIVLWTKHRPIVGLLLILPLSVSPVFSPVQVAFFMAERYLYLTSVFFCILLVILLRTLERELAIKRLAIFSVIAISILYSGRTLARNNDWQNSKSLWLSTAKVSPNSPRVHNNIGDAYSQEGDYENAILHFQKAIELNPTYTDAIYNLELAKQRLEQL